MVLHSIPFEHANRTVVHPDRYGDRDRTLWENEAISQSSRDIDVFGDQLELVASQLKARVGVDVLHRGV